MTSPKTIRSFTHSQSQTICSTTFNYVLSFTQKIDRWIPSAGFTQPIIQLEELKVRIEKSTGPFLTIDERDQYIGPILDKIIAWKPEIRSQLLKFWEAQIDIGNTAVSDPRNPQYDPMTKANEAVREMTEASNIYLHATDMLRKNPTEKLFLYAIIYSHILRTETAEYAFRKDLEDLINQFGLQSKYDVNAIFSVQGKIQNRKGDFNTDARAMRDAFAHFQYEVNDVGNTWEIEFLDTRPGFYYNKKFTNTEFLTLMENTDLLYKSILHLIWMYVGSAVAANAFVK